MISTEPLHYLVFDPGETTGVAEFDINGQLITMTQMKKKELFEYLDSLESNPPSVVIYEEYMIFAHKAASHSYSKVPTIQIIGAIVYFGHRIKAQVVEQKSQCKPLGYKYSGMTVPKNHSKSHGPDAMAHGYYYLINNNIIGPDLKSRRENGAP